MKGNKSMGKVITKNIFDNLNSSFREKMENAFNTIYNEYSYLVFYVSFKIVRNNEDAKDITNETFLKFYNEKSNIRNYEKIKYYLVSTSKNLSLNLIEKRKREKIEEESKFISETKRDYFWDYIEKFKGFLDENEIDIVVYHILYDFTFKEIARFNNVSVNSMTSKYKRIIDKIRKHYEGDDSYGKI